MHLDLANGSTMVVSNYLSASGRGAPKIKPTKEQYKKNNVEKEF